MKRVCNRRMLSLLLALSLCFSLLPHSIWAEEVPGTEGGIPPADVISDSTVPAASEMALDSTTVNQLSAPTVLPAAGLVPAGTQLTLQCDTAGASIYYNTVAADAQFPENWTLYADASKPTVVDGTYYIKAVNPGWTDSAVVSAAYTTVAKSTIAEARAGGADKTVFLEGTVVNQYTGSDMKALGCYFQDETGGILLYDSSDVLKSGSPLPLQPGDQIQVIGSTTEYKGKFEVQNLKFIQRNQVDSTITPVPLTIDDATTASIAETKEGMLATISGLQVKTKSQDIDKNCILTLTTAADTTKTLTAKLDSRRPGRVVGDLENMLNVGDVVTLTGIMESNGDNTKHLLQLRGKEDVTINEPCTVIQPVKPSKNGGTVKAGETITFTCETPGVTLEYHTISPDEVTGWIPMSTGVHTIPTDWPAFTPYAIYVRAVREGYTGSGAVTVQFSQVLPLTIGEIRAAGKGAGPFTVTGVATTDYSNKSLGLYIQDETGGIMLFGDNFLKGQGIVPGDLVTATGTTDLYSGKFELVLSKVPTKVSGTQALPIRTNPTANYNKIGGMLVAIDDLVVSNLSKDSYNNVSFTGTWGGKTVTVKYDSRRTGGTAAATALMGSLENGAVVRAVGILEGYDSAYTLLLRDAGDVTKLYAKGPLVIADVARWDQTDGTIKPMAATSSENGNATVTVYYGDFGTSKNSVSTGKWNSANQHVQFTLSTQGFGNLMLSAKLRSSSTGPRDFKVQYSLDGSSFQDVPGSGFQVVNTELMPVLVNVSLPSAVDNQAVVYIRWVLTSNTSSNGTGTVPSSGIFNFTNVVFSGDELPSGLLVNATPSSGEVAAGTTVTLKNEVAGSTVEYRLYTDAKDKGVFTTYTTPIELTTLPAWLETRATNGSETSRVRTFAYTQLRVAPVRCSLPGGGVQPGTTLRLSTTTKEAVITYDLVTKVGTPEAQTQTGLVYDIQKGIAVTEQILPFTLTVHASKTGWLTYDGQPLNFTKKQAGTEKLYFGQLHSHTAEYSDGSGTLAEALDYAKNKAIQSDFVAFTDHSNYFDSKDNLGDITDSSKGLRSKVPGQETQSMWQVYTETVRSYTDGSFVGLPGYEMTWSGGPGHINTFNTTGIVSRNNQTLNNKNADAGMKAYYSLLTENPQTISQFNHPGPTFGTFADFGYYSPDVDNVINMLEVGNGEGAIGSSGYFPSYQYYDLALGKGWHVAPTNNQDNHKGKWGDSNTARSVILTDDFTESGLYQGMRDMRMYATEDNNLEIRYTLNAMPMGSMLSERPATVDIQVQLTDPDAEGLGEVSVVTESGRIVASKSFAQSSATWDVTLQGADAAYAYYYIRVVQPDRDIAVTAPVWLSAVKRVGITSLDTKAVMSVKGTKQQLTTKLYNYESLPLTVEEIKFTVTRMGETTDLLVLDAAALTSAGLRTIAPSTDLAHNLDYTPQHLGFQTITVNVKASLPDPESGLPVSYVFTKELELEVLDRSELMPMVIDGGHNNFYVSGNYANSDANFIELAAQNFVLVERLGSGQLTPEKLKGQKLLILTVPFKSFGTSVSDSLYSQAELNAIAQFAAEGGNIVVCSKSDRGDPTGTGEQASVISNQILEALGAKARIGQGIVIDEQRKSNELFRISMEGNECFHYDATDPMAKNLLKDIAEKTNNTFSAYNSAPVLANGATPLVKGFSTTWATRFSSLKDNTTLIASPEVVVPKGDVNLMTVEPLSGGGFLVVSGVTFFSTFEVKVEMENAGTKQNSNYQLVINLLNQIKPEPVISTIAAVHQAQGGEKFTVQGIATSHASGYDKARAFFDCIYIQDATGGINVFPVDANIQEGQLVQVTGYTSAYQGERQLQAKTVSILDSEVKPVTPTFVTASQAMSGERIGSLMRLEGTVVTTTVANGILQSIILRDSTGGLARVFIDGYITPDYDLSFVKAGALISVEGLGSYDAPLENTPGYESLAGHRLRISDRAKIKPVTQPGTGSNLGIEPGYTNILTEQAVIGSDRTTATATVTAAQMIGAAHAADSKNQHEIQICMNLPTGTSTVGTAVFSLDGAGLDALAKQDRVSLTLLSPLGTVQLPPQTLDQLTGYKRLTVTVGMTANGALVQFTTDSGELTLQGNCLISLPLRTFGGQTESNAAFSQSVANSGVQLLGNRQISLPLTTIGAQTVSNVAQGGWVLMQVHADGTLSPIVKSVVDGQTVRAVLNGTTNLMLQQYTMPFNDLSCHWAADEAAFMSGRGLLLGLDGKNFAPGRSVTRAMAVSVLHRMEGTPATAGQLPADVPTQAYYADASRWALAEGIAKGTGGGAFEGTRSITRAELATVFYRYAATQGMDMTKRAELSGFADADTVPDWGVDAMSWCVAVGLMAGDETGALHPNQGATRGQLAAIGQRMIHILVA